MSEYRSNLGHDVEEYDFREPHLYHKETTERTYRMEQRMRDALNAVGMDPNGDDPRKVATTTINGMTAENTQEMLTLAAGLWHPDLIMRNAEIDEELGVLTPAEVAKRVTERLAILAVTDPKKAIRWLTQNPKTDPTPYINHMDESGHGSGTAASIHKLRDANKLELKGANMEVGSGPGNIAAHLIERQLMPDGTLHLVDSNTKWLGHAIPLVRRVDPSRRVNIHPSDAALVNPSEEIHTLWTALTLQWFDAPQGTISNMQRIMAKDGTVFFIGETPTNATANTPRGLHGGLDIGFSNGAFTYEQVCRMFEANGFVANPSATILSMSMPAPNPEFLEALSPEQRKKAELMLAYSDHLMVGTAWKKAQ